MSDGETPIEQVDVDFAGWVETARSDPVLYLQRQVTEIVLTAIGLSKDLRQNLVLKGGTLMALAFKSDRVTGDVDFTARPEPSGFSELLIEELDNEIPKAANKLGYLNLACRVQRVEKRPRPQNFENLSFPALLITIGYAERGSAQEKALDRRNAAQIIALEVSFRDQVYQFQELCLIDAAVAVQAFSLSELIAEKFRALLQQPIRNRHRRQDVFDISFLLKHREIDEATKSQILKSLILKCQSREIEVNVGALENPQVIERAKADWETIRLEVENLPDFDEAFDEINGFFRSLNWHNASKGKS